MSLLRSHHYLSLENHTTPQLQQFMLNNTLSYLDDITTAEGYYLELNNFMRVTGTCQDTQGYLKANCMIYMNYH